MCQISIGTCKTTNDLNILVVVGGWNDNDAPVCWLAQRHASQWEGRDPCRVDENEMKIAISIRIVDNRTIITLPLDFISQRVNFDARLCITLKSALKASHILRN